MRTKNPHSLRTYAAKEKVSHMTVSRQLLFTNSIEAICSNIEMAPIPFLTLLGNAYPKIPTRDLILISKISPEKQKELFDNILPDCIDAKQIIKNIIAYHIGKST